MRKLYKRDQRGALLYHEAWSNGDHIIEHFGRVGDRGETRELKHDKQIGVDQNVDRILNEALANGFEDIVEDELQSLVIEYAIIGFGTDADIAKRHELEERMNATLGWTGLGHCDGGSTGSGTMEVFCPVVDFNTARAVVERDLAGTRFADFTRIYNSSQS